MKGKIMKRNGLESEIIIDGDSPITPLNVPINTWEASKEYFSLSSLYCSVPGQYHFRENSIRDYEDFTYF